MKKLPKKIDGPKLEEIQSWFMEHYEPSSNDVVINLPTPSELDDLQTTASGLLKGGSGKEDFIYTILCAGSEVTGFKSGDKVIIQGNMPVIVAGGFVVSQVSKHQVKGKIK